MLSIFATVASVKVFVGKAEGLLVVEWCDWKKLKLLMDCFQRRECLSGLLKSKISGELGGSVVAESESI